MNGKPLPLDSKEMKAMVAYYTFISRNVPDDTKERPWAKLKRAEGDLTKVNIDAGREVYNKACITCHGEDGSGGATGLALWGENPITSEPVWRELEQPQGSSKNTCLKALQEDMNLVP